MPVQITINGENAAEAVQELSVLAARLSGSVATPAIQTEVVAEAPKTRKRTQQADPVPVEKDPEPIVDGTQETTDPGPSDDDVPTVYSVEDLRAKAAEVAKSGKQAGVKKVLTDFGASSISAVPDDKRTAVYEALEAVANE